MVFTCEKRMLNRTRLVTNHTAVPVVPNMT